MRVNIRTRTCICVHATQRTLHACACVNMRVCWCPLSPYQIEHRAWLNHDCNRRIALCHWFGMPMANDTPKAKHILLFFCENNVVETFGWLDNFSLIKPWFALVWFRSWPKMNARLAMRNFGLDTFKLSTLFIPSMCF